MLVETGSAYMWHRAKAERGTGRARFRSAPDLRGTGARPVPVSALRRPLRRYALSVDEPPHSAVRYYATPFLLE